MGQTWGAKCWNGTKPQGAAKRDSDPGCAGSMLDTTTINSIDEEILLEIAIRKEEGGVQQCRFGHLI